MSVFTPVYHFDTCIQALTFAAHRFKQTRIEQVVWRRYKQSKPHPWLTSSRQRFIELTGTNTKIVTLCVNQQTYRQFISQKKAR